MHDIKDRSPNQDTINKLEYLLERAKTGELRSVLSVCAWDDDEVTHGWSIDQRNSKRRILAELILLQNDHVNNIELLEGDSVLARQFQEWP